MKRMMLPSAESQQADDQRKRLYRRSSLKNSEDSSEGTKQTPKVINGTEMAGSKSLTPIPSEKQSKNVVNNDHQKVSNIAMLKVHCGEVFRCLMKSCNFQAMSGASFEKHISEHDRRNEKGGNSSFCFACDSRIAACNLFGEFVHLVQRHIVKVDKPVQKAILAAPTIVSDLAEVTNEQTQETPEQPQVSVTSESAFVEGASNGVQYRIVITNNQSEEPSADAADESHLSDASEDKKDLDLLDRDVSMRSVEDNDDSMSSVDEDKKFKVEMIFKSYASALALFFFHLWIAIACLNMKLNMKLDRKMNIAKKRSAFKAEEEHVVASKRMKLEAKAEAHETNDLSMTIQPQLQLSI